MAQHRDQRSSIFQPIDRDIRSLEGSQPVITAKKHQIRSLLQSFDARGETMKQTAFAFGSRKMMQQVQSRFTRTLCDLFGQLYIVIGSFARHSEYCSNQSGTWMSETINCIEESWPVRFLL